MPLWPLGHSLPCLTLEQLPCFLPPWSCPLSAPWAYSRVPALLGDGRGWARLGRGTAWGPDTMEMDSTAPCSSCHLPCPGAPSSTTQSTASLGHLHSATSLLAPSLAPLASGLSPPLAAGAPWPRSQWGGAWDRWQHTVSSPQLCLCPSVTPRSTPQPFQEAWSLGLLWKDPPLRPALALSTCPARRARSRQRRAPRMMQMMTGTETLLLLVKRPWVGSAWARTWKGQHQAWERWGQHQS